MTAEAIIRVPLTPTENQIEAALYLLPDMPPDKARRTLRKVYDEFLAMRPEAKRPQGITKKMAQLLETICEYEEEHGHGPTRMELAAMFGIDRRAIDRRLNSMKIRGYIRIKGGHRGIVVLQRI